MTTAPDVAGCCFAGCPLPAWNDGPACLHHSPHNGATADDARQVWRSAREVVRAGQSAAFDGWHFPADPDRQGFSGLTFTQDAHFAGAVFHGEALFARTVFASVAIFDGATFEGDAHFDRATFDGFAAFDGVAFGARADFSRCAFSSEAWFIAGTFTGPAEFLNACFSDMANFNGATFRGSVAFSYVAFGAAVQFSGATFHDSASFSILGSRLPSSIDVDRPSLRWFWQPAAPFVQPEQGAQAYRLAKQVANLHGDYARAGEYHYAEQCAIHHARRKSVGWRWWSPRFWWCWGEYLFARGLLGYGEKPSRVLLAGVVVIFGCALLFLHLAGIAPTGPHDVASYQPTFAECLHFSAVTFTTVGYGDYLPKPDIRLLADIEGFVGAAFMAMFVVALTRKYAR